MMLAQLPCQRILPRSQSLDQELCYYGDQLSNQLSANLFRFIIVNDQNGQLFQRNARRAARDSTQITGKKKSQQ